MAMQFSQPTLHHPVLTNPEHLSMVTNKFAAIAASRHQLIQLAPAVLHAGNRIKIPITTVSLSSNFDAYINVRFKGSDSAPPDMLLVDSGNSTLIMPHFELLSALPNFTSDFQILADGVTEPWGCPAAIIRGPIELPTVDGTIYSIPNCVFFACKGSNGSGGRTANFGIGCVSPWSTTGVVSMQSPLSYDASHPLAELNYAPTAAVITPGPEPVVNDESTLNLYTAPPEGYRMFGIIPNIRWMSLTPRSLTIGTVKTQWPGNSPSSIAMIDSGGGPVYLSDPGGYLYREVWPEQVALPPWTADGSVSCQAVEDDLQIELGSGAESWSFQISTASLPPAAKNLTLVICKTCRYMMDQYGMNVGGISALFNFILIDYAGKRVGFKNKVSDGTPVIAFAGVPKPPKAPSSPKSDKARPKRTTKSK
jgi:hypothetical protein